MFYKAPIIQFTTAARDIAFYPARNPRKVPLSRKEKGRDANAIDLLPFEVFTILRKTKAGCCKKSDGRSPRVGERQGFGSLGLPFTLLSRRSARIFMPRSCAQLHHHFRRTPRRTRRKHKEVRGPREKEGRKGRRLRIINLLTVLSAEERAFPRKDHKGENREAVESPEASAACLVKFSGKLYDWRSLGAWAA